MSDNYLKVNHVNQYAIVASNTHGIRVILLSANRAPQADEIRQIAKQSGCLADDRLTLCFPEQLESADSRVAVTLLPEREWVPPLADTVIVVSNCCNARCNDVLGADRTPAYQCVKCQRQPLEIHHAMYSPNQDLCHKP